jgi:NADPH:quinone reductase-like Zn-dependent oxidoreductase
MTIPKTMRAVAIDRYGDPSVLTMHTLPVPEIEANEVLIAVNTAGVEQFERLDRAMRQARLQIPIAKSYTLANAARAHEHLAAGHVLGKVVLRVAES